jgi:dihydroxyacetone kinase-like protein
VRFLEGVTMSIDMAVLRGAIERIDAALVTEAPRLTELDGKLGDGDLGITLSKAFAALKANWPAAPPELGPAFFKGATKVSEVSSSSFGTLFATALMGVGKALGSRTSFEWDEIAGLLATAEERMIARGKASLGDKTVLDAIHAAIGALKSAGSAADARDKVRAAVKAAVDDFAAKPNKVGRARIFAEKSEGIPDPGMAAFAVMVDAM